MTTPGTSRRLPVLLVSRDLETQDLYVLVLRLERIPVLGVSSCDDALALVRQTDVSAVLFDVERPSDWESVTQLRREVPAAVPIVVLTGWVRSDGANRSLAQTIGCAGFLAKPVPPDAIVDVLQRTIGGCRWAEYVEGI